MSNTAPTKNDSFRYFLTSTGYSSKKYGLCEVCHAQVFEVYIQNEQRSYFLPETNREGWTGDQCRYLFGHEACLQNAQAPGSQVYRHTTGKQRKIEMEATQ